MSPQSHLSVNDKGDNEMKMGLCIDLSAFTLRLRKMRKPSARRPSDEGCAINHRLKSGPLPPNDVGKIAQHVRGERRDVCTTILTDSTLSVFHFPLTMFRPVLSSENLL